MAKKSQHTPGGFMPKKSAVGAGRPAKNPPQAKVVGGARKSNQLPASRGGRKK